MMEIKNKRIWGYDLLKMIAMFLVVLYHLGNVDYGGYVEGEFYLPNVTKALYAFCSAGVPLFFMVNGALVVDKCWSLKKTILKSAKLVFVSFTWVLLLFYGLLGIIYGMWPNLTAFRTQFWFLNTLALIYIVSYVLGKAFWLKTIVICLLLIVPFLSNFAWDLIVLFNPQVDVPFYGHTGVFTLYSIVYFYLGFFLRNKIINKRWSFFFILIGIALVNIEVIAMTNHDHVVYDGVNASFPTLGAMSISSGLFCLFKNAKISNDKFRRFVFFIGRNTIGIYVFHGTCLFFIRHYSILPVVINPFLAIIISIAILILMASLSELLFLSRFRFLLKL